MKRMVLMTAVLLSGVLLSSCGLTGLSTLEEEVDSYNKSISTMQEKYKPSYTKLEERKDNVLAFLLKGEKLKELGEGVEVTPLTEEQLADYRAYMLLSNDLHTTTNYNAVTQTITLVGYKTQMLVEVVWLDKKIVYIEYTIKEL